MNEETETKRERNRKALDKLMHDTGLNSTQIAARTAYNAVVIRQWRTGSKRLPTRTLKFIKLALDAAQPSEV